MRRIGLVFVVLLGLISCKKEIHSTQNTVLFGKIEGTKPGHLDVERLTDCVADVVGSVTYDGHSDFSFALRIVSHATVYSSLQNTTNAPIKGLLAVIEDRGKIDLETTRETF